MKKTINLLMEIVLGAIFIFMLCMTVWQIFSRFILNDPSSFSEEALRFAIIWLVILGSSYATLNDKHFGMTLISDSLHGIKGKILKIFSHIISLTFCVGVLIIGGYISAASNMAQFSPILGMPVGLIYVAFVLSGILSAIICLYKIYEILVVKETS